MSKRRPEQMVHTVHLSSYKGYPKRAAVKKVSWLEEDEAYSPVEFTHEIVLSEDRTKKEGGWADPPEVLTIAKALQKRKSFDGKLVFEKDTGRPINVHGRTGIRGRGLLGKWGPNFAADPLVTRVNPETKKLQFVAITRADTGALAMPGGMVDDGEKVSQTVKREFIEEAANFPAEEKEELQGLLDELFSKPKLVFQGYVDDPRNTDNAWMETSCFWFHCNEKLGKEIKLQAGDDAVGVRWLDIIPGEDDFETLHGNHKDMILAAIGKDKKFSKYLD